MSHTEGDILGVSFPSTSRNLFLLKHKHECMTRKGFPDDQHGEFPIQYRYRQVSQISGAVVNYTKAFLRGLFLTISIRREPLRMEGGSFIVSHLRGPPCILVSFLVRPPVPHYNWDSSMNRKHYFCCHQRWLSSRRGARCRQKVYFGQELTLPKPSSSICLVWAGPIRTGSCT